MTGTSAPGSRASTPVMITKRTYSAASNMCYLDQSDNGSSNEESVMATSPEWTNNLSTSKGKISTFC